MIARIDDLVVDYPGYGSVLRGISLSIAAGEIVAAIGASGAGKTTLAHVLADGAAPAGATASWSRFEPAARAALIEQEARESLHPLLRVTAQLRDCLPRAGARSARAAAVARLLGEVGLEADVHGRRYPHQLSGGEAQRVAVARALALEARLLLADEITSGLDAVATARVLGLIRRLAESRGMACLIVTHDLDVCRRADRVLVLSEGTVVEEGTPEAVLSSPRDEYTRELVASARERLL